MKKETIHANMSHPVACGSGLAKYRLMSIFSERLSSGKVAVVTDREVAGYHLEAFLEQFRQAGISVTQIVLDSNLSVKSIDSVKRVYEGLFDASFSSGDILFSLGGGGIQDIAGFAAMTYWHGIPLVQIPTSLLAMAGCAADSHAFLNFQSAKDRLSVQNKPIYTVIDPQFLNTLPSRYFADGVARIIRYGLVQNTELLDLLQEEHPDVEKLISLSLVAKGDLEKSDSPGREFGLEIGEAIEEHFRFLKYSHGEAMALGMLSMYPDPLIKMLYTRYGLPRQIEGVTKETLLNRIIKGRIPTSGNLSFTVLEKPGLVRKQTLASADARTAFDRYLSFICS